MKTLTMEQAEKLLNALKATSEAVTMLMEAADTPINEDEVFSAEEAAQFLKVSKGTLLRLVHERKIPFRNFASSPGKILPRMLKSDLIAFIKSGMPTVKQLS